ncbi:MAG: hypothetical protein H8E48_01800 [Chloroflexi bacterium]|nr:hypothetical protein [Chloroflexota bacterium]
MSPDGVSVVFPGDHRLNPEWGKGTQDAALRIQGGSRTGEEREIGFPHGHSTAGDAGRAAAQASVEELVITHLDSAFDANPQPLLDDAMKHYSGPTSAATDLHQITVTGP